MVSLALALMLSAGPRPDCNLSQRRFDNYLGDGTVGGLWAPRWVHHSVHIALSGAVAYAVHRFTGWKAVPSTTASAVIVGMLPHARGLMEHHYPFDRADAAADLTISSEPLLVAIGSVKRDWWLTGLAVGLSYFAASCHASP